MNEFLLIFESFIQYFILLLLSFKFILQQKLVLWLVKLRIFLVLI